MKVFSISTCAFFEEVSGGGRAHDFPHIFYCNFHIFLTECQKSLSSSQKVPKRVDTTSQISDIDDLVKYDAFTIQFPIDNVAFM